ncbi:MAG: hypothetical protein ACK2UM_08675 [Anaerolineales bacterium]|jgi:hypothetical protein
MERTNQVIIDRAVRIRKQLAELEEQRAQYGADVPKELWDELVELSRELDREEGLAKDASRGKSQKVNQTRKEIIETLNQYNQWREQMRQVEDLFLVHLVRPGYRLRQAVLQREYLEREYQRLRRNINIEHYTSLEELTGEIQDVLKYGDAAYDASDEEIDEEVDVEKSIFEIVEELDIDQLVDVLEQEAVVREFKRVVLPEIHPDTSNSSPETFNSVYESFKQRDYLLMQAYIVQYRGEVTPDENEDPIVVLEQIDHYQDEYIKLKAHLDHRLEKLNQELTPLDEKDPAVIKEKMRSQQIEIDHRIHKEAEKILELRQKIEDLAVYYLEREG